MVKGDVELLKHVINLNYRYVTWYSWSWLGLALLTYE